MEPEKMLGLLLHTTEQQSETVEKLLAELRNHIAALVAATKAAEEVSPALQSAVREAARKAVVASLSNAPQTALAAFKAAAAPFFEAMGQATTAADGAASQIRDAGAWFGWKVASIAAGLVVVGGALGWGVIAWEGHQVKILQGQKTVLQEDLAQLSAQVAALEKRGGKIKLSTCGGRLCVEASTNQGGELKNWNGPWKNDKGTPLVIPQGY